MSSISANTNAVSWPQAQEKLLLKRVEPISLDPPHAAQTQLAALTAAIRDVSSYEALLLKNVTQEANSILKRVIANSASRPVYRVNLTLDDLEHASIGHTAALLEQLQHPQLDAPLTLYIYLDQADHIELRDEKNIDALVKSVRATRTDTKLIFAAPAPRVDAGKDLCRIETRNIGQLPWDLHDTGQTRRIGKLLTRSNLVATPDSALALLKSLPHSMVPQVLGYAQVLGQRRYAASTVPASPQESLADLAEAARCLRDRLDLPEATAGTAYVEQFLVRPDPDFCIQGHVAGVPKEVKRFLCMVKNYEALKSVVPSANKTLLLKGPPGTGKTTLARALAAETGYPLFAPKSSSLINSAIGASADNVYRMFRQASSYAKAHNTTAIIFFDEIDALLTRRSGGHDNSGGAEREYSRVVNAFLESLQGVDRGGINNLVIIGATNLSDQLDPAMVDRFAMKVEVGLPERDVLRDIFRVHLANRAHDLSAADLESVVSLATHFSGRHVVNALDRAGFLAFEKHQPGTPLRITVAALKEAVRLEAQSTTHEKSEAPFGMYT